MQLYLIPHICCKIEQDKKYEFFIFLRFICNIVIMNIVVLFHICFNFYRSLLSEFLERRNIQEVRKITYNLILTYA